MQPLPRTITSTYDPSIFDVGSLDHAMGVILTPDDKMTTAERWRIETPYLCDLIAEHIEIDEDSIVLDYGCGIGRMARALIERHNCRVVGADISPTMRGLAAVYVNSERFIACHPAMIGSLGVEFDAAISIWALQHCLVPQSDIATIRESLKDGGAVFVANEPRRFVPVKNRAWLDDGLDIRAALKVQFTELFEGRLDQSICPRQSGEDAFYWVGRK